MRDRNNISSTTDYRFLVPPHGLLVGKAASVWPHLLHFVSGEINEEARFNQFYYRDVWLFNKPRCGLSVCAPLNSQ